MYERLHAHDAKSVPGVIRVQKMYLEICGVAIDYMRHRRRRHRRRGYSAKLWVSKGGDGVEGMWPLRTEASLFVVRTMLGPRG